MKLLTHDGLQKATVRTCNSKKTGLPVYLYKTKVGVTYISHHALLDGSDVRHALTDAFG